MIEIIQVNISGEDKPGLTTALTGILAKYDAFQGLRTGCEHTFHTC